MMMRTRGWQAAGSTLTVPAASLVLSLALAGCSPADGGSPPAHEVPVSEAPAREAAADQVAARWMPSPGVNWQWQLSGALDLTVEADVFDVDYETTTAAEIGILQGAGRRSVCYLSAGSWEEFRGDAGDFPESVRGQAMSGWPDEQWLDIRRRDILLPIMAARMDTCAAKGFDAVEPDNVDGYVNTTGFPLTASDQLAYNRALAELAHTRGLSVALKNDVDQIPDLVDDFDFALNEECVRYTECDLYQPFTEAGKAVLHVEYEGPLDFCAESKEKGLSSMLKPLDLGAAREAC